MWLHRTRLGSAECASGCNCIQSAEAVHTDGIAGRKRDGVRRQIADRSRSAPGGWTRRFPEAAGKIFPPGSHYGGRPQSELESVSGSGDQRLRLRSLAGTEERRSSQGGDAADIGNTAVVRHAKGAARSLRRGGG